MNLVTDKLLSGLLLAALYMRFYIGVAKLKLIGLDHLLKRDAVLKFQRVVQKFILKE